MPVRGKKEPRRRRGRWVAGVHACREVLSVRPEAILQVLGKKGSEGAELCQRWERRGQKVRWVSDPELKKITRTHQGVAMEVGENPELDWKTLEDQEKSLVILLDEVVDPQNLGAILRTAWLMGVAAVFTTRHRSAGLTPTVCKVACGAAEHVPVVIENQLGSTIKDLKKLEFWVLGLAAEGAGELWQQELPNKVAWVVGSEEKGLRKPVARDCDQLVRIFQSRSDASYNASVAAAIALAESRRQHLSN